MRDFLHILYLDIEWEAAGIMIFVILSWSAWFHLKSGNRYGTAIYFSLAGFVAGRLISEFVGPFACG